MKHLITKDTEGGTAWLTNEHYASRYGIPVLEIAADDVAGVFGPADIIGEAPKLIRGAQIVAGWASVPGRTEEEIIAARAFCQIQNRADARSVELIGEFSALQWKPPNDVGSKRQCEAVRVPRGQASRSKRCGEAPGGRDATGVAAGIMMETFLRA